MISRLRVFIPLAVVTQVAFAAIGPVTDLTIENAIVSPDGSVERG
jgi:hypothetical protein